jgi:hypothetical protein
VRRIARMQFQRKSSPSCDSTNMHLRIFGSETFALHKSASFRILADAHLFLVALAALSTTACATTCNIVPEADRSIKPRVWCEHSAVMTLDRSCSVRVVETITVPWWNGTEQRTVGIFSGQALQDVKVTQVGASANDSGPVKLDVFRVVPSRASKTLQLVELQWSMPAVPEKGHVWELSYVIVNGVLRSTVCSYDPKVASTDTSDMASLWKPEAVAVDEIKTLNVTFRALRTTATTSGNTRSLYDGAAFTAEDGAEPPRANVLLTSEYKYITFQRSEPTTLPRALTFIVWHGASGDELDCIEWRDCSDEQALSQYSSTQRQDQKGGSKMTGKVTGITVGVLFVVGLAVIASLVVGSNVRNNERQAVKDGVVPTAFASAALAARTTSQTSAGTWDKDVEVAAGPDSRSGTGSLDMDITLSSADDDMDLEPLSSVPKSSAPRSGEPCSDRRPRGGRDAPRSATGSEVISAKDLLRRDFENTLLLDARPKSAKVSKPKGKDKGNGEEEPVSDKEPKSGKEPRSR